MASIVPPSGSGGQPSLLFAGLHELSTSGVHSTTCRHGPGRLLPHLLTLAGSPSACFGGCFLLHGPTLASPFPLGSGMPCVARTFLPPPRRPAADRFTVSGDKGRQNISKYKIPVSKKRLAPTYNIMRTRARERLLPVVLLPDSASNFSCLRKRAECVKECKKRASRRLTTVKGLRRSVKCWEKCGANDTIFGKY